MSSMNNLQLFYADRIARRGSLRRAAFRFLFAAVLLIALGCYLSGYRGAVWLGTPFLVVGGIYIGLAISRNRDAESVITRLT